MKTIDRESKNLPEPTPLTGGRRTYLTPYCNPYLETSRKNPPFGKIFLLEQKKGVEFKISPRKPILPQSTKFANCLGTEITSGKPVKTRLVKKSTPFSHRHHAFGDEIIPGLQVGKNNHFPVYGLIDRAAWFNRFHRGNQEHLNLSTIILLPS